MRAYIPKTDCRMDLWTPSAHTTGCAYKVRSIGVALPRHKPDLMHVVYYFRALRITTTSYCHLGTPLRTYYGATRTRLRNAPPSKVLWHFSTKDWTYGSTGKSRNDRRQSNHGYTHLAFSSCVKWRSFS